MKLLGSNLTNPSAAPVGFNLPASVNFKGHIRYILKLYSLVYKASEIDLTIFQYRFYSLIHLGGIPLYCMESLIYVNVRFALFLETLLLSPFH